MKKTDDKDRKLTKAEQKRWDKFLQGKGEFEQNGYEMKEHTLGLVYANIMAFVVAIPIIVPFALLFYFVSEPVEIYEFPFVKLIVLAFLYIVSIVVHEALHGITWACFAKNHFKSIEFGVIWEMLTPYCTCSEVLKKWQYVLGSMMPLIVLGIVPCIIAVISGNIYALAFGAIMVIAAGGDIIVTLRILRYKTDKNELVFYDHPTKCGFITFER